MSDWDKTQAAILKLATALAQLAGEPPAMPDPFPCPPFLEPEADAWLAAWNRDQRLASPPDLLLRRLILARLFYAAHAAHFYKRAGARLPISLATPENLVLLVNELWRAGGRMKWAQSSTGGRSPQN